MKNNRIMVSTEPIIEKYGDEFILGNFCVMMGSLILTVVSLIYSDLFFTIVGIVLLISSSICSPILSWKTKTYYLGWCE